MTTSATPEELVYRIDAGSTIVYTSANWNSWFAENTAPGGTTPSFLGTRLWNHLGDPSTIHLYQAVVAEVRRKQGEIVLPFRCDAPDKRRYMEMHIRSLAAGIVEFRSVTVREESRQPIEMTDLRARHSGELLRMCSWCKQVALPEWVDIEQAARRLRVFEAASVPRITHTICPTCAEIVRNQLKLFESNRNGGHPAVQ